MSEGILFIISAPSGAGKTSLVKALVARDPKLSLSISCTTRPPRVGEQDGVHYHFIDRVRFEQCIGDGDFLEHAEVFGNRYGTREADVRDALATGRDLILEIDWQGARQVRERFDSAVGIFILPPSIAELENRLRVRGQDSPAVVADRMSKSRDEISHWAEYDYVLVNSNLHDCERALRAIIKAERLRRDRQPDLIRFVARLNREFEERLP